MSIIHVFMIIVLGSGNWADRIEYVGSNAMQHCTADKSMITDAYTTGDKRPPSVTCIAISTHKD
jgi:hypothetical protein